MILNCVYGVWASMLNGYKPFHCLLLISRTGSEPSTVPRAATFTWLSLEILNSSSQS